MPDPTDPDWSALAPGWDPASRTQESDHGAGRELDAMAATAGRVAGGGIRAAVLGVNDGLVTNLCLILGMAGASADAATVRLAGLSSLFAGALSMAAGEWVSVSSQREVAEGMQSGLDRAWRLSPPVVLSRMSRALRAEGIDPGTAARVSKEVAAGPSAERIGTRVMFGVSAADAGSPMTAAISSLALFAVGALVPLLPWFVTGGAAAAAASGVLTGIASLAVGGVLGGGSGRGPVGTAVRQLLIVAGASAVTYGLGVLSGSAVG